MHLGFSRKSCDATLKDQGGSAEIARVEEKLRSFHRKPRDQNEIGPLVGADVMLTALDIAQNTLSPEIASRVLRMMTTNKTGASESATVVSFLNGQPVQPLKQALNHSSELIRYWAAVTVSRSDIQLTNVESPANIISLLTQAISKYPSLQL